MLRLDRVVAVVAELAGDVGDVEQVGSGYLIGGRRVLTAKHCTQDKTAPARAVLRLFVRRTSGEQAKVARVMPGPGDLALLDLADAPWDEQLKPPSYGRVDRSRAGLLGDCVAIGYPLYQRDPSKGRRSHGEIHGVIYQTDGSETGRLLLREPRLTSLPDTDPSMGETLLGGLSGALVFHQDTAIGVIVEHHPYQPHDAVTLSALDTLTDDDLFRTHLGLPPQLPIVTGAPVEPLEDLLETIGGTHHGEPLRVDELDPYRLGATPSDYGDQDTYGNRDPYVPRGALNVDSRLVAALEPGNLVVVVGPSKAGKTRTAYEAIRSRWPTAHVVAPEPTHLRDLASHPRVRATNDAMVIWLDDIHRHLNTSQLTRTTINQLAHRLGPTVLIGTLRSDQRDQLRVGGELAREAQAVLDAATLIDLASTLDHPDEDANARSLYPEEDLGFDGIGETLGYAHPLLDAYHDSATSDTTKHHVIRTAIDWARTGLTSPIAELDLASLALRAIRESRPDLDTNQTAISTAITRARTVLPGTSHAAPLITTWLDDTTRGYRPYDYLTASDNGHPGPGRPIPEWFWEQILARHPEASGVVTIAAYQQGAFPIAIQALNQTQPITEAADPNSMSMYALILASMEPPDLEGARLWMERAAQAGYPAAMSALGDLLSSGTDADLAAAQRWKEKAALAGNVNSMLDLSGILMRRDPPDLTGARRWCEKAARAGNRDAMNELGVLFTNDSDPPDLTQACYWFEQAANAGHDQAMTNLGILLQQRHPPDLTGARHWYEKAAKAGNDQAMLNLSVLLATSGTPGLADVRRWLEMAATHGNALAMLSVAPVYVVSGDVERARALLGDAGDGGSSTAALLREAIDDNVATAESACNRLRLLPTDTDALNFLGVAAYRSGDIASARELWSSSRDQGDVGAPLLLAATSEIETT